MSLPPPSDALLAAGPDPRHHTLGFRMLGPRGAGGVDVNEKLFPAQAGTYQLLRRLNGVPEGAEVAALTALESNQELLGAVAFDKGCYLGQELTARSHFKGVVRKRLLPAFLVAPDAEVPPDYVLGEGGAVPRLTVPQVGSMLWSAQDEQEEEGAGGAVVQAGAKLSGKGGVVVTPPLEGSNVAVLQLRLDKVLRDFDVGNVHEVEVGGDKVRLKILPFVPAWWPDIDVETGKARKEAGE